MAKQLQLRGGTTSEHSTFTGAVREVTVDTDKDTLVVHDGGTAGGFPLATATNFASTGIDDNATSTAITINSFEQVGIGTTSPNHLLHLKQTSGDLVIQTEGALKKWSIRNHADGYFGLYNHTHGRWLTLSTPGAEYHLLHANGSERMRITPSGNVGIGTTAPTEKLYVAGNIYATGNITAYSDERLKTNINELNNTLSAIQNIRGISYTR